MPTRSSSNKSAKQVALIGAVAVLVAAVIAGGFSIWAQRVAKQPEVVQEDQKKYVLSGRVTEAMPDGSIGAPVIGAIVTIEGNNYHASQTTGAEGHFSAQFATKPDNYAISVRADGYQGTPKIDLNKFITSPTGTINVPLTKLASRKGKPISGKVSKAHPFSVKENKSSIHNQNTWIKGSVLNVGRDFKPTNHYNMIPNALNDVAIKKQNLLLALQRADGNLAYQRFKLVFEYWTTLLDHELNPGPLTSSITVKNANLIKEIPKSVLVKMESRVDNIQHLIYTGEHNDPDLLIGLLQYCEGIETQVFHEDRLFNTTSEDYIRTCFKPIDRADAEVKAKQTVTEMIKFLAESQGQPYHLGDSNYSDWEAVSIEFTDSADLIMNLPRGSKYKAAADKLQNPFFGSEIAKPSVF